MVGGNRWYGSMLESAAFLHSEFFFWCRVIQLIILRSISHHFSYSLPSKWTVLWDSSQNQGTLVQSGCRKLSGTKEWNIKSDVQVSIRVYRYRPVRFSSRWSGGPLCLGYDCLEEQNVSISRHLDYFSLANVHSYTIHFDLFLYLTRPQMGKTKLNRFYSEEEKNLIV